MKSRLTIFDFDGTLTLHDTLPGLIAHCVGRGRCVAGFALFAPQILLMKCGLINNSRVKERLLRHFFKGWDAELFGRKCREYASRIEWRKEVRAAMDEALERGDKTLVISANIYDMVRAAVPEQVEVCATRMEVRDGVLTGRFDGKNCYGAEKLRRLRQVIPHPAEYYVTMYGDSRGDAELMAIADEKIKV